MPLPTAVEVISLSTLQAQWTVGLILLALLSIGVLVVAIGLKKVSDRVTVLERRTRYLADREDPV